LRHVPWSFYLGQLDAVLLIESTGGGGQG
jgi:hypothetical protein